MEEIALSAACPQASLRTKYPYLESNLAKAGTSGLHISGKKVCPTQEDNPDLYKLVGCSWHGLCFAQIFVCDHESLQYATTLAPVSK